MESLDDLQRPLLPDPSSETHTTTSEMESSPLLSDPPSEALPEIVPEQTSDGVNHVATKRWYQNSHQIMAMVSNFSTSYNVVNISLVLPIVRFLHSTTEKETAMVASSLLAGMIFGQLVGGALGDSWLGRMGALRLVMALQIIASLASAFTGVESLFLWLAIWRFILGIGCGGVYPLAAVISAEQGNQEQEDRASDGDNASPAQRVVLTFSMQGVGFVSVPLVAVLLFCFTSDLNFIWRTMLGVGALPGFILIFLQCRQHSRRHGSSPEGDQTEVVTSDDIAPVDIDDEPLTNNSSSDSHGGWMTSLFHEPGLGRKVLGTAGTWFLFDIVFYGNTIFQPIVVEAAFGKKRGGDEIDLLRQIAIESLILTSIALPGYAMAGLVMGKKTFCVRQTPRYVMLQGFAAMTILYATIGFNWTYLRGDPATLVFLYGMTFFFANYGPNTTTFILPSLIFEEEHRATWNGVSAAAGKLGALTGATLFAPAADKLGDHVVMLICSGVALFAFVLTFCAIPKQQTSEDSVTPDDATYEAIVDTPSAGEMA